MTFSILRPYPDAIAEPLSRILIAALRKADCVSFHLQEGRSTIVASKRNEPTAADPFAPHEMRHEIVCGVQVTDYHQPRHDGPMVCFGMVHGSRTEPLFQTIVATLREGDSIVLSWGRDAWTNPNIASHGLAGDTLHLVVTRPGGKRCEYFVDHSITRENCSARMVRPARPTHALRVA